MSYRSLALAVAAFSSMHVASADAQSVYVAPGGGYEYGPPVVVAPAPAVVAPTTVYGPNEGYYGAPLSAYAAELLPRPPVAVPYYGSGRCVARYGYGYRQSCY